MPFVNVIQNIMFFWDIHRFYYKWLYQSFESKTSNTIHSRFHQNSTLCMYVWCFVSTMDSTNIVLNCVELKFNLKQISNRLNSYGPAEVFVSNRWKRQIDIVYPIESNKVKKNESCLRPNCFTLFEQNWILKILWNYSTSLLLLSQQVCMLIDLYSTISF